MSIFFPDELFIRFAEDSLIPINETFIKDDSLDTCTSFQRRNNAQLQHTHFRIRKRTDQMGDINVTIIGTKLGCGYNIYLTPLSLAQAKTWLGRWNTCTLLENSTDMGQEICSYLCMKPGFWRELQVLKVPRTVDELYWEVCYINVSSIFSSEFKITLNTLSSYLISVG